MLKVSYLKLTGGSNITDYKLLTDGRNDEHVFQTECSDCERRNNNFHETEDVYVYLLYVAFVNFVDLGATRWTIIELYLLVPFSHTTLNW